MPLSQTIVNVNVGQDRNTSALILDPGDLVPLHRPLADRPLDGPRLRSLLDIDRHATRLLDV